MTEVLPEASAPHQDHQHHHDGQQHHDGQHQGGEHPAMFATPPHTFPPSAPPSMAGPTHHPGAPSHPGTQNGPPSVAHRGREKLHWDHTVWERLDHAVAAEAQRTRVAAKFLPVHRVHQKTTTIESDVVIVPPVTGPSGLLAPAPGGGPATRWAPQLSPPTTDNSYQVDEGASTRLVEFWVEFSLTPQQVEHEGTVQHDQHGATHPAHSERTHHAPTDQHMPKGQHGHQDHPAHSTAHTMATKMTNLLGIADDMLHFQGLGAFTTPLFANFVRWRANGEPTDWGLLNVIPAVNDQAGALPLSQVIQVPLLDPTVPGKYGNQTFAAATQAYALLIAQGYPGPFAMTLHNVPYADAFAPLPGTLIMPADRIAPLMTAGFLTSGTLDSPGVTAAAQGAAAAAGAPAGSTPQQLAATAAALYALQYGATPAVAAKTGSQAAAAAGALTTPVAKGLNQADSMGQTGVVTAAGTIPNYPPFSPTIVLAANGLPSYYGSMVSLGGNTMDRVVGIEPTVAFMQQDVDGSFRFRVFERVALRVKDIGAVIRFEFQ
jgi:hypothetical protein